MQFMGFPDDGADEEFLRRMSAPENEIPVAVPMNSVLVRTDHAALALLGLQVFTTGLSFELALRCRPSLLDVLGHDIGELLWGSRGGPGQLLLGVEFADGRRASSLGGQEEADVWLNSAGASSGTLSAEQSWWLHPLPAEGPLRLIVRCDPLGMDETSTEIDGEAIRRAAADVVTLWPWVSPERAVRPPGPAAPDLPEGSWFRGPR
jgi:hypothetical protein